MSGTAGQHAVMGGSDPGKPYSSYGLSLGALLGLNDEANDINEVETEAGTDAGSLGGWDIGYT